MVKNTLVLTVWHYCVDHFAGVEGAFCALPHTCICASERNLAPRTRNTTAFHFRFGRRPLQLAIILAGRFRFAGRNLQTSPYRHTAARAPHTTASALTVTGDLQLPTNSGYIQPSAYIPASLRALRALYLCLDMALRALEKAIYTENYGMPGCYYRTYASMHAALPYYYYHARARARILCCYLPFG